MTTKQKDWINALQWPANGLLPVVAQDADSGKILMLAWMNAEALSATADEGRAIYWSRSRQKLWRKGEQSGHVQWVRDIRIDCDADAIVLQVEQQGGIACHTGRQSCFFRQLSDGAWRAVEPVLRSPEDIYGK